MDYIPNNITVANLFTDTSYTHSNYHFELEEQKVKSIEELNDNFTQIKIRGFNEPIYIPHKKIKKKSNIKQNKGVNNVDQLTDMVDEMEIETETETETEEPFWEHFLEEKNFKLLVNLGKKNYKMFDEETFLNLIPECVHDFNLLSRDDEYTFSILEDREMTIRSYLYSYKKYPEHIVKDCLHTILRSIYMGVLEYSGYTDYGIGNWIVYNENSLTFLEHKLMGLEIG